MKEIILIAAYDRKLAIGKQQQLPWRLPNDLKRFKALTTGHPILMGRRTFESIGKPLPHRQNLVLSRQALSIAGAQVVHSLSEALALAQGEQVFVIGGSELYTLALPFASKMLLTEVDTEVLNADAYFPEFDQKQWQCVRRESHAPDRSHACGYCFVDWQRRAPGALSCV
jgi:dihydrofolate reductase